MSHAVPVLHTPRLTLRPLEITHADAYERQFVDYEVIRHLSSQVPWPYPQGGVRDFIENTVLPAQGVNRWDWGLFLKSAPSELVGSVGLWRGGEQQRGFWLARPHWGQGLMTEACEAVNGFAFEGLGFESLVFSNAVGNLASRRIKEKTGAVLLGQRPAEFVDPQYRLAEFWELTRSAWERRQVGDID